MRGRQKQEIVTSCGASIRRGARLFPSPFPINVMGGTNTRRVLGRVDVDWIASGTVSLIHGIETQKSRWSDKG